MVASCNHADQISIERVDGLQERSELGKALDPIFFAASATRTFPDEQTRTAFRERWLGRYLTTPEDRLYVAKDLIVARRVAGYLVGSFYDPALDARFDDIGYFSTLGDLTAAYPAHLHVNLDDAYRNRGLGSQLVSAFAEDALAQGSTGVHVVTGAASRNLSFYARNGFDKVHRFDWKGHAVVFLGRSLLRRKIFT